jgi:L-threonylcarbamoyladenylate synthase
LANLCESSWEDFIVITRSIDDCVKTLMRGDLVAIPTETVYGLAADAVSQQAVRRIYEVKGRPLNHPVIVHISGVDQIEHWATSTPSWAYSLAEKFWPGPLTLILPRSKKVGDWITGGQETVGLRVPNHPAALEIITKCGLGLAAPSANRFGAVSPTTAVAVLEDLGLNLLPGRDLIFDGGECAVGLESTIVDATARQPSILRLGAVTSRQIEEATGLTVVAGRNDIRAPGTLANHYSPRARVHLDFVEGADGFIALSDIATPSGLVRLSSPRDIFEFAQGLYEALRRADALGLHDVVALAPVGEGIAAAIRDRLERAASRG